MSWLRGEQRIVELPNELAKGGTEDCSAAKCLSLVLSCSKVTEPSADSVWQKNWAGQGGVGRVAGWANGLTGRVHVSVLWNCLQSLYPWLLPHSPGLPILLHFYKTKLNITSVSDVGTFPGSQNLCWWVPGTGIFKQHHPPTFWPSSQ